MEQVDFSKYQVVTLVNNKEIIIRDFNSDNIENDFSCLKCAGIFTLNNLFNNWVNLVINKSNILYTRDLFDSEKRIVRQVIIDNEKRIVRQVIK